MSNTLAVNTLLQNRYRIRRKLGQGGFGAVYLASDMRLNGRLVAVKENFDNSPEAQEQFQLEANVLAMLHHPNLPGVTDYFVEPVSKRQYLVMDYVQGDDLIVLVQNAGHLGEAQALEWLEQVCDALTYLHSRQPPVIHRDLKPTNIRIRSDQRAMLVDFGIAKLFAQGKDTAYGARGVSAGYSPLEQYGMGTTTARSDLYSLGATMYFMFTGLRPPEATERASQEQILKPPRHVNPTLALHLEQAILKAMALDMNARFETADELRRALRAPQASNNPKPFVKPPPNVQVQPAPQQPVSKPLKCHHCGAMNRSNAKVCQQCGKALKSAQNLAAIVPPPAPKPAANLAKPKAASSPEKIPPPPKPARVKKQPAPPAKPKQKKGKRSVWWYVIAFLIGLIVTAVILFVLIEL